jgi:hypothetical protein
MTIQIRDQKEEYELNKYLKDIYVKKNISKSTLLINRKQFRFGCDNFINFVNGIIIEFENNIIRFEKYNDMIISDEKVKKLNKELLKIKIWFENNFDDGSSCIAIYQQSKKIFKTNIKSIRCKTLDANNSWRWENCGFFTRWTRGLFWNEKSWDESMDVSERGINNYFNNLFNEYNIKERKIEDLINEIIKLQELCYTLQELQDNRAKIKDCILKIKTVILKQ